MIHGRRSTYSRHNCRCNDCVSAQSTYFRDYLRRVKNGEVNIDSLAKLRARTKKQNDKPKFRLLMKKKNDDRRAYLYKLKDIPCSDCGNKYRPEMMDFDHRPGTEKKFTIGTSMQRNWKAILDEVEKCDIVCGNCHRMRTIMRKRERKPK